MKPYEPNPKTAYNLYSSSLTVSSNQYGVYRCLPEVDVCFDHTPWQSPCTQTMTVSDHHIDMMSYHHMTVDTYKTDLIFTVSIHHNHHTVTRLNTSWQIITNCGQIRDRQQSSKQAEDENRDCGSGTRATPHNTAAHRHSPIKRGNVFVRATAATGDNRIDNNIRVNLGFMCRQNHSHIIMFNLTA